ncbi:MAG: helix-turn-helix transcriptional regulator [Elusimicrobia bacterium]|nr:helix-turn-helix transcriptional regulator [Elusimicrobiota bacterium]
MSAPMKKLLTDSVEISIDDGKTAHFVGPRRKLRLVTSLLKEMDFESISDAKGGIPWREAAKKEIAKYGEPGLMLRGARKKEGLSQVGLAKKLGIAQYNLSKMENGKRPIGKKMAMKLAETFNTDYRVFM